MPLQFSDKITPYALGRRANMEEWNSITRTAEAAVGFGVPVQSGTVEHTCKALLATTGQNVLGITEARQILPHPGDAYEAQDNVTICEVGVIGVRLGADVTAGAVARFNTANQTWTGAAQSATVVTIPGAQFEYAGKSGEIGLIRYRRPVPSLSISGA